MSVLIESPTNPLIKEVAALHQKKARQESGHLLVETRHPIEEALRAGLRPVHCFVREGQTLDFSLPAGAEAVQVSEKAMTKLSTTDSPPPCVAVFEAPKAIPAIQDVSNAFLLVLDQIQDPGNLGTLIRSAVAFGVSHLVLTPGSADVYSPKVIRASAGLVFRLPVMDLSTLSGGWHFHLATTHALGQETPRSYREVAYPSPIAIVLGNEGRGISEALIATLEPLGSLTPVMVPMPGDVESLNVGVSGSIILAEAAAKRGCSE